MSKLKEMQDSCAVFAADLKTGNVVWETVEKIEEQGIWGFQSKVFGLTVTFQMMDVFVLNARQFAYSVVLKSTTAKEAAHEALQLVKQEAQKLVDALEVEPKEDNYSKDFLEWRGKYFYSKKEVKEWKSKQNNTSYSNKELEDRYKNAFLDFPFNAKQ